MPGCPHGNNHRQELHAIGNAVHIKTGQGLAAAIHFGRFVRLCPLMEGAELRSGCLDFLDAGKQGEQRAHQVRTAGIHILLNLPGIVECEQNDCYLQQDDGDSRVEQGTAVDKELHEHDAGEKERQDRGQETGCQVGADARYRQQAIGEVAGRILLRKRFREGQQTRHQGRLQCILHLVLDTHHHQVAGYLHHRQSDGCAQEQCGYRNNLACIARRDDLRENQLACVWCKHGQQGNTHAGQQGVKPVIYTQTAHGIANDCLGCQLFFCQRETGNHSTLFQQVVVFACLQGFACLWMNERIVRKPWCEYHRGVVIGHES